MKKTIYVLHEYGAPSHYNALVELGKQNKFNVKFRTFNPKIIIRDLFSKNIQEAIKSLLFIFSLPFSNRRKIVLGIAPFNKLLYPLSFLLKRHKIFYHTSYTCWDGSITAHPTNSDKLKNYWINFIGKKTAHIFAVSQKTKTELINNFIADSAKISIVNHSYNIPINYKYHKKDNSFIFVGRLIENKGILELLSTFSQLPEAKITIVGKGELEDIVLEYSRKYNNIIYQGYINGLENIIPLYQQNSFLLMNSHKTGRWEELFGIAIIEGMACGCVPLATNHPGPKEIITPGVDGFLFSEGDLKKVVSDLLSITDDVYQNIRKQTIKRGQSFHCSQISSKWDPIINA